MYVPGFTRRTSVGFGPLSFCTRMEGAMTEAFCSDRGVISVESLPNPQRTKQNQANKQKNETTKKEAHLISHQWLIKRKSVTTASENLNSKVCDGLSPSVAQWKMPLTCHSFCLLAILPVALLGLTWEMHCAKLAQETVLMFQVRENSQHWSNLETKA